jgi:hypothetical protein
MGALSEFGKLGLTSIGNSPEEAQHLYQQIETVLDQETMVIIHDNNVPTFPSLPITWTGEV